LTERILNEAAGSGSAVCPQSQRKVGELMLTRYYHIDVNKLELLLVQKGWAASEIAARGVFSQRRVEQLMQGGRVFRTNLKRLADLFEVKPEELMLSQPHCEDTNTREEEPNIKKKAEFSINLCDMPDSFDENSVLIQNFTSWLKQISSQDPTLVDYDDNEGRVAITVEIPAKSLVKIYLALVTASRLQHCVFTDLVYSPWKRLLRLPLLPFIENIRFPHDCPLEPFRGKTLRSADGFEPKEPIDWDSIAPDNMP